MILYKNTKAMVRITDFFDADIGVLPEGTLAPDLFVIYLDYVLQTLIDLMKENGFRLRKELGDIPPKIL